jgi:hypothetical protein
MTRPRIQVRYWTWRSPDQTETPGIGLFNGNRIQAHLTADQARNLADKLHDFADRLAANTNEKEIH